MSATCLTIHSSRRAFWESTVCAKKKLMDGMNGTKNRVPLLKGHMLAYQMLGKEALANCLRFFSCQSHFRRYFHRTQMEYCSSFWTRFHKNQASFRAFFCVSLRILLFVCLCSSLSWPTACLLITASITEGHQCTERKVSQ